MTALRTCRVCGLEAHTEEDLEQFVKFKESLYGHLNICKKCFSLRESKERKTFIEHFITRPRPCFLCGEEITELEGQDGDSLSIHSLDGNHYNWDPENKVPVHHGCHVGFHNRVRHALRQDLKPYLRKCRVCGLEAHSEEDLELFKKDKHGLYGRRNLCKECLNKYEQEIHHSRKERGLCWSCGKPLDREGCYCKRCLKVKKDWRRVI